VELRLASEHVVYEIERLFGMTRDFRDAQRAHYAGENPSPWTRDALLTAWTIHLRNTMHFVRGSSPQPHDILAAHYFPGDAWWELLGQAGSGWTSEAWRRPDDVNEERLDERIDKEILHLTYERIHCVAHGKRWHVGAVSHLAHDLDVFLENVPSELVTDDFAPRTQTALDSLR
jgi:hypothetical protein